MGQRLKTRYSTYRREVKRNNEENAFELMCLFFVIAGFIFVAGHIISIIPNNHLPQRTTNPNVTNAY